MAVARETMQMLRQDYSPPPVDLSWLDVDQQWGMKAKPGKRGLTLDEVNIGAYGPTAKMTSCRAARSTSICGRSPRRTKSRRMRASPTRQRSVTMR